MAAPELDPEIAAIVALLPQDEKADVPLEELRAASDRTALELGGDPEPLARVEDRDAAGVPVRVYEPDGAAGTLLYLHGGGWVVGSLDGSDRLVRRLARASGARVVSAGYRLAPEHPFPAPLDDAARALAWAAEELARDAPLAVGGDSAGANLAAVLARRARDGLAPRLAAQLLVYPVTDAMARAESAGSDGLTRAGMDWYWSQYLQGADPASEDVSPLRARRVAGLPPAYVLLAAVDPLRAEGAAYAERLRTARVPVTLAEPPGTVHGFVRWLGQAAVARRAVDEAGGWLRERLSR